jgi:hypothetical protein
MIERDPWQCGCSQVPATADTDAEPGRILRMWMVDIDLQCA